VGQGASAGSASDAALQTAPGGHSQPQCQEPSRGVTCCLAGRYADLCNEDRTAVWLLLPTAATVAAASNQVLLLLGPAAAAAAAACAAAIVEDDEQEYEFDDEDEDDDDAEAAAGKTPSSR